MKWDAIVLAAGSGTRMKSKTPKVLQKVAGLSMIARIVRELSLSGCQKVHIVVSDSVVQEIEALKADFSNVEVHIQKKALGTGDAVLSVPQESLNSHVFICNGDHPLMSEKEVSKTAQFYSENKLDLLVSSLILEEPGSFGRIVKEEGKITKIVEAKEASAEELKINEINAGIYFGQSKGVYAALDELKKKERNSEFYLTDIVNLMKGKGFTVGSYITSDEMAFGVNDSKSLYLANKRAYRKKTLELLEMGVKFIDIESAYIDEGVNVGQDTLIYPNVYLRQGSQIGEDCVLESGVHISNSKVGNKTYIKAGCYIEGSDIKGAASIGPYARLREGSLVEKFVKIGNFVETKKTHLKEGVKAGHQCYLGDSEIGEGTNIGAGTITCNFAADGKKYKTKIGKNVFIGSDTQIVPPVEINDDAVIAAGATVTKDVEAKALYVTRSKAVIKSNYRK